MNIKKVAIILGDHKLFVDSFEALLEDMKEFHSILTFSSVEEIMASFHLYEKREIFLFIDYYVATKVTMALISEIRKINSTTKVIFVTDATSSTALNSIFKYLPNGIISKFSDISTITNCYNRILQNRVYLDDYILEFINKESKTVNFTDREIEVLRYFSQGLSVIETAKKINLSPHTIVAHRRKMMTKANCNSITQLLKYAKENDLLDK